MKRLSMRKIREALRLSFEGLSTREMALGLAIGRTTLREYLGRARDAGNALSDADLEHPTAFCGAALWCKGVTLSLLWQE